MLFTRNRLFESQHLITASLSPCLVRGNIHHGCLFDGVWGGQQTCGDTPSRGGWALGEHLLLIYSILSTKLRPQVHSSIQKQHADLDSSHGRMQGQLSTNCDPGERLGPKIGPGGGGLWGLGVGFLSAILQWLSFTDWCGCTNVCDRDHSISRRPTVHSYDTCAKSTKRHARFPRKSCVKDERCAHCSLKNGFAYGSCS